MLTIGINFFCMQFACATLERFLNWKCIFAVKIITLRNKYSICYRSKYVIVSFIQTWIWTIFERNVNIGGELAYINAHTARANEECTAPIKFNEQNECQVETIGTINWLSVVVYANMLGIGPKTTNATINTLMREATKNTNGNNVSKFNRVGVVYRYSHVSHSHVAEKSSDRVKVCNAMSLFCGLKLEDRKTLFSSSSPI